MADYIPYTQTKEYFQTKVKEGCEQINCGSSATGGDLVIFKQPLKYKNFTLPLFYRLFSTGVDLNLLIGNENAKNFLERLVSNPLCLRCQIIGRPFKNRAELPLFNHTLYTYLLDLEVNQIQDEDAYLAFLSSKVRNQIRRGYKQGLVFKELSLKHGVKDYVNLRQQSRVEAGLPKFSEGFLERQISELSGSTRIFVVEHDNQIVSGQIAQHGQNIFTLTGVCTSKMAHELRLNANDLMQYSIVGLAARECIRFVDWAGAQPQTKNSKISAIDKYKKKWGGELTELPSLLKGYSRR